MTNLQPGETVRKWGRYCTVKSIEQNGDVILEHTDAGRVTRVFRVKASEVQRPKESLLDTMADVSANQLTPHDRARLQTEQHMADPKPGDIFHEMFSFWVAVLAVEEDKVTYRVTGLTDPLTETKEEFRNRFAYDSMPGYFVAYHSTRPANALWCKT